MSNLSNNKNDFPDLIICPECENRVTYHVRYRLKKFYVEEYKEYYGVCDKCGSEMFVPGLADRGNASFMAAAEKVNKLMTDRTEELADA